MAEDDAIFDPSMKKKKKKKKTPFDMEAALTGETTVESTPTETPVDNDNTTQIKEEVVVQEEKVVEDITLDLEFGGKKKKKKKKIFDMDGLEDALPDSESKDADKDGENTKISAMDNDIGAEFDFTQSKKKKKKKRPALDDDSKENENEKAEEDEKDSKQKDSTSWAGSERDYTYDELLTRVFDIMRAKNPDMVSGEKKRFVMRPPQVVRVGAKKSSFVNFADICKMLHRQPNHLLAFLLAELGTSGSIDGNNQLIIKGRFQQKQIENVLRRYIKEYVTCHTCRSPDTILQKDNRLFFLQCEKCHSRCSVASIKSGFQAVTMKRAQIRAKTK
ncbi:eukaryotic translation initiation factor 2 subunit 2-like isoform X2 [Ptychodera flava]|uniref:eukaryotic translation initiation factor 2 subunit 2-like isoform X2 n=1 Tax=Ptychodera flava TaxID=63121 RepID=UPI003969FAC9